MRIEKFTEQRKVEGFYHKIADIPAGVSVKTSDYLSNGVIKEASLLYPSENGLYIVATSSKVVEDAQSSATTYAVAKGHLFKVGDKIKKNKTASVNITAINTSDANKDVLTLSESLGVKRVGDVLEQHIAGEPIGVVGESVYFRKGDNVLVSAQVIAVINKNIHSEPLNKPVGIVYV